MIAPRDGWMSVGSGRKPVLALYVARSWSPSLLTTLRTSEIDSICSATSGSPAAMRVPFTSDSIHLVPPAILLPGSGWGSNVSNWLGPPCIQRTITDLAGLPLGCLSADRASRSASGVSQHRPDRPAAFNSVRRLTCDVEPQSQQ